MIVGWLRGCFDSDCSSDAGTGERKSQQASSSLSYQSNAPSPPDVTRTTRDTNSFAVDSKRGRALARVTAAYSAADLQEATAPAKPAGPQQFSTDFCSPPAPDTVRVSAPAATADQAVAHAGAPTSPEAQTLADTLQGAATTLTKHHTAPSNTASSKAPHHITYEPDCPLKTVDSLPSRRASMSVTSRSTRASNDETLVALCGRRVSINCPGTAVPLVKAGSLLGSGQHQPQRVSDAARKVQVLMRSASTLSQRPRVFGCCTSNCLVPPNGAARVDARLRPIASGLQESAFDSACATSSAASQPHRRGPASDPVSVRRGLTTCTKPAHLSPASTRRSLSAHTSLPKQKQAAEGSRPSISLAPTPAFMHELAVLCKQHSQWFSPCPESPADLDPACGKTGDSEVSGSWAGLTPAPSPHPTPRVTTAGDGREELVPAVPGDQPSPLVQMSSFAFNQIHGQIFAHQPPSTVGGALVVGSAPGAKHQRLARRCNSTAMLSMYTHDGSTGSVPSPTAKSEVHAASPPAQRSVGSRMGPASKSARISSAAGGQDPDLLKQLGVGRRLLLQAHADLEALKHVYRSQNN